MLLRGMVRMDMARRLNAYRVLSLALCSLALVGWGAFADLRAELAQLKASQDQLLAERTQQQEAVGDLIQLQAKLAGQTHEGLRSYAWGTFGEVTGAETLQNPAKGGISEQISDRSEASIGFMRGPWGGRALLVHPAHRASAPERTFDVLRRPDIFTCYRHSRYLSYSSRVKNPKLRLPLAFTCAALAMEAVIATEAGWTGYAWL